MLVNNKVYDATISSYGSGIAKASGKAYFYIEFSVENESIRWIGSPMKNNGEINDFFPAQIAAAGFDAEKNSVADISNGYGSDVLNDHGTTKVRVSQVLNGQGEKEWSIGWIGESQTKTKEETVAALPSDINEKLKGKFPKPTRTINPDLIPF